MMRLNQEPKYSLMNFIHTYYNNSPVEHHIWIVPSVRIEPKGCPKTILRLYISAAFNLEIQSKL